MTGDRPSAAGEATIEPRLRAIGLTTPAVGSDSDARPAAGITPVSTGGIRTTTDHTPAIGLGSDVGGFAGRLRLGVGRVDSPARLTFRHRGSPPDSPPADGPAVSRPVGEPLARDHAAPGGPVADSPTARRVDSWVGSRPDPAAGLRPRSDNRVLLESDALSASARDHHSVPNSDSRSDYRSANPIAAGYHSQPTTLAPSTQPSIVTPTRASRPAGQPDSPADLGVDTTVAVETSHATDTSRSPLVGGGPLRDDHGVSPVDSRPTGHPSTPSTVHSRWVESAAPASAGRRAVGEPIGDHSRVGSAAAVGGPAGIRRSVLTPDSAATDAVASGEGVWPTRRPLTVTPPTRTDPGSPPVATTRPTPPTVTESGPSPTGSDEAPKRLSTTSLPARIRHPGSSVAATPPAHLLETAMTDRRQPVGPIRQPSADPSLRNTDRELSAAPIDPVATVHPASRADRRQPPADQPTAASVPASTRSTAVATSASIHRADPLDIRITSPEADRSGEHPAAARSSASPAGVGRSPWPFTRSPPAQSIHRPLSPPSAADNRQPPLVSPPSERANTSLSPTDRRLSGFDPLSTRSTHAAREASTPAIQLKNTGSTGRPASALSATTVGSLRDDPVSSAPSPRPLAGSTLTQQPAWPRRPDSTPQRRQSSANAGRDTPPASTADTTPEQLQSVVADSSHRPTEPPTPTALDKSPSRRVPAFQTRLSAPATRITDPQQLSVPSATIPVRRSPLPTHGGRRRLDSRSTLPQSSGDFVVPTADPTDQLPDRRAAAAPRSRVSTGWPTPTADTRGPTLAALAAGNGVGGTQPLFGSPMAGPQQAAPSLTSAPPSPPSSAGRGRGTVEPVRARSGTAAPITADRSTTNLATATQTISGRSTTETATDGHRPNPSGPDLSRTDPSRSDPIRGRARRPGSGRSAAIGALLSEPAEIDESHAGPDPHRVTDSIPVSLGWRPRSESAVPESAARPPLFGSNYRPGPDRRSLSIGGRHTRPTTRPPGDPEVTDSLRRQSGIHQRRSGADRPRSNTGQRRASTNPLVVGRSTTADWRGTTGPSRRPRNTGQSVADPAPGTPPVTEERRSESPHQSALPAGADASGPPPRTGGRIRTDDRLTDRPAADDARQPSPPAAEADPVPTRRSTLRHRSPGRSVDPPAPLATAAETTTSVGSLTAIKSATATDSIPPAGAAVSVPSATSLDPTGSADPLKPAGSGGSVEPLGADDSTPGLRRLSTGRSAVEPAGIGHDQPAPRATSGDSLPDVAAQQSAALTTAGRDPTVLSMAGRDQPPADAGGSTADVGGSSPDTGRSLADIPRTTATRSAADRTAGGSNPVGTAVDAPTRSAAAPSPRASSRTTEDESARQRPRLTHERPPPRTADRGREADRDRRSAGRDRQRPRSGRSGDDRSSDRPLDGSPSRGDRAGDGPPTENDRSAAGANPFEPVQGPDSRSSREPAARHPEAGPDRRTADRRASDHRGTDRGDGRSETRLPGAESLAYDADVDRLVETLYRRLERRVRIERERTGF